MNTNQSRTEFASWVKILGFGLGFLWIICVGIAWFLNSSGIGEKGSHFGDFFGCYNALISLLGFGTVIYSLKRQHQDSVLSAKKHRETIERETNMDLYTKRLTVFEAVEDLLNSEQHPSREQTIYLTDLNKITNKLRHSKYLFPKDSEIWKFLDELSIKCAGLSLPLEGYEDHHVTTLSTYQLEVARLQKWVTLNNGISLFDRYLTLMDSVSHD